MGSLNSRRFTVTNAPGTAGNFTVGPAVSPSKGLDATHEGRPLTIKAQNPGSGAWEIRRGCFYTHGTTTLTRGQLEASSDVSDAAINLDSSTIIRVITSNSDLSAGGLMDVPFTTAIKFDCQRQMAQTTITGPTVFTIDTTDAIDGGTCLVDVIANGSNEPTFSGAWLEWPGMAYDNRAGIRNCLTMQRRRGLYWRMWTQAVGAVAEVTPVAPSFSVAPSLTAAAVGSAAAYTSGVFAGAPTPTSAQQWTLDGVDIVGATGLTYTPAGGDVGKSLRVRQIVTNGSGSASSLSNAVTIAAAATVPGAPTIGTATAGDASASVAFTSGSTGGSPILDTTVTSSPGGITATGTTSPIAVPGLTNGTAYTFTAAHRNAIGTGPSSAASNSATPVGAGIVTRLVTPSNVTETGDGTIGWSYSNTNSNLFTVGTGRLDKSRPASTDCSFEFTMSAALGSSRHHIICVDTVQANAQTIFQCDYGIWVQDTGAISRAQNGTYTTLSGVSASGGEKLRLAFIGTTIVLSMFQGGSWITLHTYTGVAATAMFCGLHLGGVGSEANNIRSTGLV